MGATLQELSVQFAKKQPHQVDYITENAPILAQMPFEEASHEMWNVYERVKSVTGASFVDLDAVLPTVNAEFQLDKVDLSVLGGKMTVGEDAARQFGGAPAYFAKKEPSVLRKSGETSENKIIYDNLRQYAIDNSNTIDAGGTGNANYSFIAVKWVSGETTGLYSPVGFSQGAMLQTLAINGGNLYEDSTGKLVYGVRMKAYFGVQLANSRNVSAIVNVNSSNIPTADEMDDMLDRCRAGANTFIYCHRKALSLLNTYKGTALEMGPADGDMNRQIFQWNGIPFITSYNFLEGTEADV